MIIFARVFVEQLLMRVVITGITAAFVTGVHLCAFAGVVTLSPQDNIQNAVDANPPDTVFVLRPGLYREASVMSLKEGDSFVGQPGAVMDGAKQLTGWMRVSIKGFDYWTVAGGVPLGTPRCGSSDCCLPDYPGCVYVQNLYVDNVDYRHVTALTDVIGRTWYYDFAGTDGGLRNNIYMADRQEPNSRTVELGHAVYAFTGRASKITIKNLLIEKYSAPIQSAALQVEGPNWLIENNEIRLNHGFGIKAKLGADNIRVLGNRVHHNGQMGIGTAGVTGGLWDHNHVAYNNIDGVNRRFEAGGSKFVGSNITISNNIVHDNYGPGLWTDQGAVHDTYDHNTSYNNVGGGIFYEISRYGVIKNNSVYGNTKNAQIVYTGSDHGRISGNTVVDNGSGGIFIQNIVGTRPNTKIYRLTDTQVTGNTIVLSGKENAAASGVRDFARPRDPTIFSDPTIVFDHNTYRQPERFGSFIVRSASPCWFWGEDRKPGSRCVGWSAWQASGHDGNGALIGSSSLR